MVKFTKKFIKDLVKNFDMVDLEDALNFSIQKWNWLSKEKAETLRQLYTEHEISVDCEDCPMCLFMKEECSKCVLDSLCAEEYRIARKIFSDWYCRVASISDFKHEARKVRDKIKAIEKAIIYRKERE